MLLFIVIIVIFSQKSTKMLLFIVIIVILAQKSTKMLLFMMIIVIFRLRCDIAMVIMKVVIIVIVAAVVIVEEEVVIIMLPIVVLVVIIRSRIVRVVVAIFHTHDSDNVSFLTLIKFTDTPHLSKSNFSCPVRERRHPNEEAHEADPAGCG